MVHTVEPIGPEEAQAECYVQVSEIARGLSRYHVDPIEFNEEPLEGSERLSQRYRASMEPLKLNVELIERGVEMVLFPTLDYTMPEIHV